MAKGVKHPDQADLFDIRDAFPVRAPATLRRALDFNRSISTAMSEAIRQSGKSRVVIAAEMTETLCYGDSQPVTEAMLNAYTSSARETHTISLVRFVAFVRATGCDWLWDVVLRDEGMIVLKGEEAFHAQASLYEKQGRELLAMAKAAREQAPTQVRMPRGRK